jgi:hypothetical protein
LRGSKVLDNSAIEADTKVPMTMAIHLHQDGTEKVVEEGAFLFLEAANCGYV